MSFLLESARSQWVFTSTPLIKGRPFTVGFWAQTISHASAVSYWNITDPTQTSGTRDDYSVTASTIWELSIHVNGTATTITQPTNIVDGSWYYHIYREISATNHRYSVLYPDGAVAEASSVTSLTPSHDGSFGQMTLGSSGISGVATFPDGAMAELWYTNTDIQSDGLTLDANLVRQLAYFGPFSLPHIAKDIIEYSSFRAGFNQEVYFGSVRRPIWQMNGSAPFICPWKHPPLASLYVLPWETKQFLPI